MARRLLKETTALMVIDLQERLMQHVERSCEVLHSIEKLIRGFQYMEIPIFATEQYPEKMGPTVAPIKSALGDDVDYMPKTSFSCLASPEIEKQLAASGATDCVLVGIEAHICILQTGKDLLEKGYGVTVLNDAITSRSIYDYSTAIAELRDEGARISSVETVLFELLGDAKAAAFKQVSQLIKS